MDPILVFILCFLFHSFGFINGMCMRPAPISAADIEEELNSESEQAES